MFTALWYVAFFPILFIVVDSLNCYDETFHQKPHFSLQKTQKLADGNEETNNFSGVEPLDPHVRGRGNLCPLYLKILAKPLIQTIPKYQHANENSLIPKRHLGCFANFKEWPLVIVIFRSISMPSELSKLYCYYLLVRSKFIQMSSTFHVQDQVKSR